MQLKNSLERYGIIAMIFHWIMALLIIGMLILGLYMVDLPFDMEKLKLYGWHKEFGALVLMLVILRLVWKLRNISPVLPSHMPNWQKLAANGLHILLYVLMFCMPLAGWLMSCASGLPVSFFGLFTLPTLIGPSVVLQSLFLTIHKNLGFTLIAVICLHIGAALQHHFLLKDNTLRRMLPW